MAPPSATAGRNRSGQRFYGLYEIAVLRFEDAGDTALRIQEYHRRDVPNGEGTKELVLLVERQRQSGRCGVLVVLQIAGRDPQA